MEIEKESYKFNLNSWEDTGTKIFPNESPPDIVFINNHHINKKKPVDGNTYLNLVTRGDGTYESIGQSLMQALIKDKCYKFYIHHCNYSRFTDFTKNNRKVQFDGPTIL
ncbi:MAG TPA: hypothetical protein PKD85_20265, partial [Saprospiraceae bacterium]|nr:hypothetical protein [Saprospiraceae bacterium]